MKIITKDITTVEEGVLINGVNCQRAMGSGVAKAYMTRWPRVREEYMKIYKEAMNLGRFQPVMIDPDKLYVANCWTQEFFGSDGRQYADYGAILASVSQAAMFAKRRGLQVYTPWVGCGLGGLEPEPVKEILEYIESITGVDFTVCEFSG
jgi:O-acetyl-ADP-ribose deacetylase (regulator of RNase III)